MNTNDLINTIIGLCPNATLGEDSDGQIVIYTDMRIVLNGDGTETMTEMGEQ